jgi:hypothetical protein
MPLFNFYYVGNAALFDETLQNNYKNPSPMVQVKVLVRVTVYEPRLCHGMHLHISVTSPTDPSPGKTTKTAQTLLQKTLEQVASYVFLLPVFLSPSCVD